ncbi:MAG: hypothetical protein ACYC6V_06625 [Bacillota bacterium]
MSTTDFDITPERRDEMIEWTAQQIHKRGLTTPAVFFIEMNRPISYVGGQAVHFFSPFVNAIFDSKLATEVGHLMSDRKNIDRLIDRLEELTREQDIAQRKARKKAKLEAAQATASEASPEAQALTQAAERSGVDLDAEAPPDGAAKGSATDAAGQPKKSGFLDSVGKFLKRK